MPDLLSIDPGLINGISWGYFDDKTPYRLDKVMAWDFEKLSFEISAGSDPFDFVDIVVIERFIPQSGGNFTLKEDDLAGVEAIGLLKHWMPYSANEVFWRTRSQKVIAGSVKESDKILKDNGLWQKGKDVNWSDGRDVNDSLLHSLGFLKDRNHEPTLRRYFHA